MDTANIPAAHTRFGSIRQRLEAITPPPGWPSWAYELALFAFKQGWACLFGALMLGLLLASHLFYPDNSPVARYDFLVCTAVAIQLGMLVFRLETVSEAKVILAFHLVGTVMEIFKTSVGSWVYPEASILRIGGVPLFSGFMYAAVGSYIARIWRIFDFRLDRYPGSPWPELLAALIYLNFFLHHWLPDARYMLFGAMGLAFWRTTVQFTVWRIPRKMPLLLGWLLVAFFIWLAENIATFSRAWAYPDQALGWTLVSPQKLGSWYLLMYISFVLVAVLHRQSGRNGDRRISRTSMPVPDLPTGDR